MNRSLEQKQTDALIRRRKRKLSYAKRHLHNGVLVGHCGGWNGVVKDAYWETVTDENTGKEIIIDLEIEFEDGRNCSLIHCCDFPAPTKQKIMRSWDGWVQDDFKTYPK